MRTLLEESAVRLAREDRAIRRVVLVVLDGLRPEAIDAFDLRVLGALARWGASTMRATTVGPSVTPPCMTSLLTGLTPERHGVLGEQLHFVRPRVPVEPVSRVLARSGLRSEAFFKRMPLLVRPLARRIAHRLGMETTFSGVECTAITDAALPSLRAMEHGLILIHWPDADRAGHRDGWMSAGYALAARRMDLAMGTVVDAIGLHHRRDTLLIATADHGGGGADIRDHDSAHPADRTIPVICAGGAVSARRLRDPVSILDIPPTILWALGAPIPLSYDGRPLVELFGREAVAV